MTNADPFDQSFESENAFLQIRMIRRDSESNQSVRHWQSLVNVQTQLVWQVSIKRLGAVEGRWS